MGISKKVLFISLGVTVVVAGAAGGIGLLAVKLSDKGNNYSNDYTTLQPPAKVYQYRGGKYSADELTKFLVLNNYLVDERSQNGLLTDGNNQSTYSFFKNESSYLALENPMKAQKITGSNFWFTNANGVVSGSPIDNHYDPSFFAPDGLSGQASITAVRLYVDDKEYSYREYNGITTSMSANRYAPFLHLVKEADVIAKNPSPKYFVESNDMIFSNHEWYSSEDTFAPKKLNWTATTLNDLSSFQAGDEFSIDAKEYVVEEVNGNLIAHLKGDKNVELDLTSSNVKWIAPSAAGSNLKEYWTSVDALNTHSSAFYRHVTPSEIYDEMIEKKNVTIDLQNIVIDGIKYIGFDYRPALDEPVTPGWYWVGFPSEAKYLLDNNAKYYVCNMDGGDFKKKPAQYNLYTSEDKAIAANKLLPLDSKFIYVLGNASDYQLAGPLKNVTAVKMFPSDEQAQEPIIYIDNERVLVSNS